MVEQAGARNYVVKEVMLKFSCMALAEIKVKIKTLENFYFYVHNLNEHAKEQKKTTNWPTFHRV